MRDTKSITNILFLNVKTKKLKYVKYYNKKKNDKTKTKKNIQTKQQKTSNIDRTKQKLILTKLKLKLCQLQNSNFDKSYKLKL